MIDVDALIAEYEGIDVPLVGLLQDIQEQAGYLPREALDTIGDRLDVPISQLYSLATFYRSFSLSPTGVHTVTCCMGTACHVRGGQRVMDAFERSLGIAPGDTTEDGQFTLEAVNCVGCCAVAPVVTVGGNYHGHMTSAKVDRLIARYRGKGTA